MYLLIEANSSILSTTEYCSCDSYSCGCDVEGNCTPDCPNYNPSDDCWMGA